AKESITSRTVTSTMAPRERYLPTCCTRSSRSWRRSSSLRADWMEAMRMPPCLRMGTRISSGLRFVRGLSRHDDLVAQEALRLFDATLEVPDRIALPAIHTDGDESLRKLRGPPRHDPVGAHEARRAAALAPL